MVKLCMRGDDSCRGSYLTTIVHRGSRTAVNPRYETLGWTMSFVS